MGWAFTRSTPEKGRETISNGCEKCKKNSQLLLNLHVFNSVAYYRCELRCAILSGRLWDKASVKSVTKEVKRTPAVMFARLQYDQN